jgi:hypothetical protein
MAASISGKISSPVHNQLYVALMAVADMLVKIIVCHAIFQSCENTVVARASRLRIFILNKSGADKLKTTRIRI